LEEVEVKQSTLICVEDIPLEGIRMGRGNECEIIVDSPSISRNHACIVKKHGDYFVFDNKSKFGTLIKDSKLYLELDFTKKGIQIDRSVLMFSICKKVSL
jgi:pSer/pThr/pTyr-binding forkhead associated (FHA) protein